MYRTNKPFLSNSACLLLSVYLFFFLLCGVVRAHARKRSAGRRHSIVEREGEKKLQCDIDLSLDMEQILSYTNVQSFLFFLFFVFPEKRVP